MGEHDENISFADMESRIGRNWPRRSAASASRLYKTAADYAATRGIIIADTKFEFGLDKDGVLHLMDEVLTADSRVSGRLPATGSAFRRHRSTSCSCAITWKPSPVEQDRAGADAA